MPADSPLAPLFEADRVAIIGASDRNHYAATIFRNLQGLGFDTARIVPVNPNRPEAFGLKAYPTVLDVPGEIPLAVVATPAKTVLAIVEQLGEKRVKAAIVLADGFREAGEEGRILQQQLTRAARERGLQLLGPNCMGLVSVPHKLGLWGGELPRSLKPGNIACVFQSSGMFNLFLNLLSDRQMGLHIGVSGGNEAVLNAADYLEYAAGCAEVDVIAMFMEAATEAQKLVRGLDLALANGKGVIVLRAGRTERAKRNVVAHTGNLAGAAAAWDALLDQHGALLVRDLDDLLETTILFASSPVRADHHQRGVGLVTISGGDCTLLSDLCEQEGIPLPELSPATLATMMAKLAKRTLVGNPLDVEDLLRQDEASFHHCLEILFDETSIDTVGVRLQLPRLPKESHVGLYEKISSLGASSGKRALVFSRASEPLAEEWHALFRRLDLPFIQEYRKGLRAMARLRRSESERANGRFVAPKRPAARTACRLEGSGVLLFAATAQILSDYGIALVPWLMAGSADEAARAAEALGYPCVLKVASPDVPHKTEYGALALGLNSAQEVRTGYELIVMRVREKKPDARIEGVLVQPHLRGVECLLGVTRDPQLGPLLVLGLGGVLVEVLRDVAIRIPPIDPSEARRALDSLRGQAILRGVRGSPPADVDALAEMASRLSWLAHDLGEEIAEIDLNPVLALPAGQGVVAVDALIVTGKLPDQSGETI